MKYGELIAFDPIQSVKILRSADAHEQAEEDVRTFVISDRMGDQLRDVIFPNLQFDMPADTRGLLVVAGYGTGKTHLMSVIAAIAEDAALVPLLTDTTVAEKATLVAGRFKVIRAEIGATTMPLRDIVCSELTKGLERIGVSYTFPDAAKVSNNKDGLTEMMGVFEAAYPGQGLLFALDELLDYLRGRRDAELIHDLQFLREVGEVCSTIRFRFMAGVQETLFDNPRFANVASDMSRVKDRFSQVRIAREDVAFVVQERLLHKSAPQRERIREHLQPFTPMYEGMAENLDEFVALFPVHPAFLKTFERIAAVEKREVLKTLSIEMSAILDQEVPADAPGLVCYDRYRARMSDDPSVRSVPEVREVLDKADVLRSRVEKALATHAYIPTAVRIVDGLAVHRLTTDDIDTPIGATTRELCDDLCLLPDGLPERDAAFLAQVVETVIDEIIRAVSGQFITRNPDNGQVYLDLRKDIDYDQKVEDRAASLDQERLDDAYFRALEVVLERRDTPYVSGYRIWEYDLPWESKNVTRLGYLFMGAPNERSTAQPPRDFYAYFLQPYDQPKFADEEKPDEVFFRLDASDEVFTKALRQYAGASALAQESTSAHRTVYEDKVAVALRNMVSWLKANMATAITVTYRGDAKPLGMWLAAAKGPRGTLRDQIETIAAAVLDAHFASRYPGYPTFGVHVTRQTLGDSVQQALSQIATTRGSRASNLILESLGLLKLNEFTADGEFAKFITDALAKAGGKVLNRSDLLAERDPGVVTWGTWNLEPGWAVVVAALLTQLGRLEIGYPDGTVDALGLDRLTRMSLTDLEAFTHLAPPKAIPLVTLREVAGIVGVAPGAIKDAGADEAAVTAIISSAATMLNRVTTAREHVRDGLQLWGAPVLETPEERDLRLGALQKLLEDVKARNTVGKLNNLAVDPAVIDAAKGGAQELNAVEAASAAQAKLSDAANYLREAAEVFGSDVELTVDALDLRNRMLDLFRTNAASDVTRVTELRTEADRLREKFADAAELAIRHDTLDGASDAKKQAILAGDTYSALAKLIAVSLLPSGAFAALRTGLVDLPVCMFYDVKDLRRSVLLPDITYRPRTVSGPSAAARLDDISLKLDDLLSSWRQVLIESLRTPELSKSVELLTPERRELIDLLLGSDELPTPVTDDFVKAVNEVLGGFEVRHVESAQLWARLFHDHAPATPAELRERLAGFLDELRGSAAEDKVRVVPDQPEEQTA